MKFRKIFVVLISVLLLLTACGKKSENGNDTVITFWGHQNESWNESYREIGKAFEEKNPGIKVEFEFFPYDQFESKVQTSLISKTGGADIYELWGGWGIDFASTGALQEMPEALTKAIFEESYPSTYGALEHEGKLFGLPLEFNIENGGMLVNNTLVADETLPKTWDELKTLAKKLTTDEVKGFDFVNWDSVPYIFTSMILSQGGQYQDSDGKFTFNTPEAKKAFQELYDMVAVDKVTDMEGLVGGGDMEGYQQLFSNKTAMVPRGIWTISEGEHVFELKYGEDFKYVAMPWYTDTPKFAAETGWSIVINNETKEHEAANKFLEFFYQDDIMLQHNIKAAMIPSKKDVAHDPALIEAMPYAAPLVDILDKAQFIGKFNTDVYKEAINDTFVELYSDVHADVESALIALESKLNK